MESNTFDEQEMELICKLYSGMSEDGKEAWSLESAQEMADDQNLYEISHGIASQEHDANDFYEVIAEFIAQDS